MSREEIDKALRNPTRNKYGVSSDKESRTADNIVFASIREKDRYLYLRAMLRSGVIRDLVLQPQFPIVINDVFICVYVADFSYYDLDQRRVIEDVKGVRTRLYAIKAKLFHICYPKLRIVET